MTDTGLPFGRRASVLTVCATSVLLVWLAQQPHGLLVALTGICILIGRRASLLAATTLGLGLVMLALVGWHPAVGHGADHEVATLLAVGFGLCSLLYFGQSARIPDQVEIEARKIVENMPGHGWSADANGEFVYLSPSTLEYVGQPSEALNRIAGTDEFGWRQVVHPDDYDRVVASWRHSLRTGEPYENEHRIRRFDGTYHWFRNSGKAARDSSGRITGWYGTTIDIDDQKAAELALQERERQLQVLVDAIPAYIWCLTPDGTPSYFNKRVMDQIGLTVDDLTTFDRHLSLVSVHPDDRPAVQKALMHSLDTGESFAMKYRQRRGKAPYRWTEGKAEPLRDADGRIVQWYGVYLDIHDEVVAQQALRERELQLKQLVDMVPSYLWRLDPDGTPNFFNKRLIDFFGPEIADASDARGLATIISTVVHPDDAAKLGDTLNRCIATGAHFSMKYRLRRADGVYRWMEGRAEPMRDENGHIVQWYGLSHDIDDQLRAEEALRERERSLRQLVETLPAMIDCAAPNGEPVYRSKQLREFLGYNLEELDGKGQSRLDGTLEGGVHPDDLAGVRERYAHALSTGAPYARKHRLRRFDGVYRWVETRAAPMRNADGDIVQWNVICLDIDGEVRAQDELRLAQESLARASQAASLAELSASIAHEVNQPLAAIVATSHACRRWLSADPPNMERAKITLERIIRDANSASEVVSRIRALFSQMDRARSPADLTEVITEVRRLMADELTAKNIHVETEFDPGLPLVRIDRIQMQQVFVNLIRNAIDALDATVDSRKLIGLRAVLGDDDTIRAEVRDAGAGMQEPDRIFEPFFTTKRNGMGMGLAICRSIIESHDGRLWAFNNKPHGTTFAFTLPIQARDTA